MTERGATVEGSVTDDRGHVVRDCMVVLFSANHADWTPYSSRSDQQPLGRNSRFRLAGVRAGSYLVTAVPYERVDGVNLTSPTTLESFVNDATEVVVSEDQHVQVNLKLIVVARGPDNPARTDGLMGSSAHEHTPRRLGRAD